MAATAAVIGGQAGVASVAASLGSSPAAAVNRVDGVNLRRRSVIAGFGSHLSVQSNRLAADSKRVVLVNAQTTETEVKVEEASSEVADAANELLKSVQETWDKTDDKLAVGSLAVAAFVTLWGSFGLVGAIDKLPLLPGLFELVGILVSGWFTYRYIIFKPDREALFKKIDDIKARIFGQ